MLISPRLAAAGTLSLSDPIVHPRLERSSRRLRHHKWVLLRRSMDVCCMDLAVLTCPSAPLLLLSQTEPHSKTLQNGSTTSGQSAGQTSSSYWWATRRTWATRGGFEKSPQDVGARLTTFLTLSRIDKSQRRRQRQRRPNSTSCSSRLRPRLATTSRSSSRRLRRRCLVWTRRERGSRPTRVSCGRTSWAACMRLYANDCHPPPRPQ